MKEAQPSITHKDLAKPTSRRAPFDHPDWIFELKHDGYRVLVIKSGATMRLLTRRGNDLLGFFPEIAADLLKLPELVINGELPSDHLVANSALLTDAYTSPVRAQHGAAKRGR